MNLVSRSSDLELMDDLQCSGDVVIQTLKELEFINQWLGGNDVTLNALTQVVSRVPKEKTITIADLGCGSGEMLKLIQKQMEKQGRKVRLVGIDANPNIIAHAKMNCADHPTIELLACDIFSEQFKAFSFDIVVGTLFFHHFDHDTLRAFFSQLKHQSKIAVVINDIHRHYLAYHSIKWLTMLLSKSTMVKFDAPLSVRRAFTRAELMALFESAGFRQHQLRWKWAFRWQAILYSNPLI